MEPRFDFECWGTHSLASAISPLRVRKFSLAALPLYPLTLIGQTRRDHDVHRSAIHPDVKIYAF